MRPAQLARCLRIRNLPKLRSPQRRVRWARRRARSAGTSSSACVCEQLEHPQLVVPCSRRSWIMAQRISASQLRSKIRQAQQKQQQAINRYNREIRQRDQKIRQAVNKINQDVRAYNSRVRADRQRVRNLLTRLNQQKSATRYVVYRTSVQTLHDSYMRLE